MQGSEILVECHAMKPCCHPSFFLFCACSCLYFVGVHKLPTLRCEGVLYSTSFLCPHAFLLMNAGPPHSARPAGSVIEGCTAPRHVSQMVEPTVCADIWQLMASARWMTAQAATQWWLAAEVRRGTMARHGAAIVRLSERAGRGWLKHKRTHGARVPSSLVHAVLAE